MKISMKKRKIEYTYGSVSGHFAFRKQKSIAFESTLERDLLTLLEFNDSVDDVIEQPITIEYLNHNDKLVSYTPDFLVYFKEFSKLLYLFNTYVTECKYLKGTVQEISFKMN